MPISAIKRREILGEKCREENEKREEMGGGRGKKAGKLVENATDVRAILADAESQ